MICKASNDSYYDSMKVDQVANDVAGIATMIMGVVEKASTSIRGGHSNNQSNRVRTSSTFISDGVA